MKPMRIVRWFPAALSLALLVTVGRADEPDPGNPGDLVVPGVSIVGRSLERATPPNGALFGSADLAIDGVASPAATIGEPLALVEPLNSSGIVGATTTHRFALEEGDTLTTVDELIMTLARPGVFVLTGRMNIVGGTRRYALARGFLDVHGLVFLDESTLEVMALLEGRLE